MVRVLAGMETGYWGDTCRFTCAVAYMYYIFTCVWHICWGNSPGHLGYFFGFSAHHLDMNCIFFILVTYLFKTFTHQIISVHPEDPLEISHFFQDNYLDTRFFFWVFRTFPGYVLHFYMCVTYLLKTFTQKIISVHPEDAPEIPHFSRDNYPDTRLFFLGFPHIAGTCTAFLPVCGIFIRDIYPENYLCTSCRCSRHFAFFPGQLPGHLGCFIQVFCTSTCPRDVQKT